MAKYILEETNNRVLKNNQEHFDLCHKRWLKNRNRVTDAAEYQEDWSWQQCGGCRYYVYLTAAFGEDWGACTNPASNFDGRVMFEHDGCEAFDFAEDG